VCESPPWIDIEEVIEIVEEKGKVSLCRAV
jgi:hypothetical protein